MATFRKTVARSLLGSGGLITLGLAYSIGLERNAFVVRESTLPVLAPGSPTLRILHLSDLHMLPQQTFKQNWIRQLNNLEPDLVVNTGDNLSHPRAVPAVIQALGGLLERPAVFVFGSNDYFAPELKNPLSYLWSSQRKPHHKPLPWQDLRAAFVEHGWQDATHRRLEFETAGVRIAIAGVDDPHINRDRYNTIGGMPNPLADLTLGLTHSPEPRVLDRFASDGYSLVLAGHTHGGQVCLPGGIALVTNCGIDRSRARGVSQWSVNTILNVSAGLGTSPYAPIRTFCRPEVSLLTLIPRGSASEPDGLQWAQATMPNPSTENLFQ